ncbi:molybdopterin-dependent oxidoreductase [Celeribacter indicus]|uniref:Oxidoreductase molybdopterin-binding domain-containing protein n=1 Tax=Celeribacter indicus TaxID=1208324 RepID=A0A0B5E8K2_9RHOB|nr:molybdopterin-dependent oxidoreductase [Celeribacter indicus]AJE48642.1 hypothetical protein P73_3927 [Celeribacter indicus]SDX34757.1 hypothetical protein SAMN05443573_1236 [Celeribacter indicus]
MRIQTRITGAALLFSLLPAWAMADLPAPSGPVLLTVSGAITRTNSEGTAEFDREMLERLPVTEFETSTIWTEGTHVFTGVSLADLLRYLGAEGAQIKASALNDYVVTLPVTDAVPHGPIIAYEMNGAAMRVRDKGPLWIVYPYDANADYRSEVIYSRSIWQLDRLHVGE